MYKLLSRHVSRDFVLRLVAFGVFANGFVIVATVLVEEIVGRNERLSEVIFSVPLLLGLTLIYLATLLERRKRAALLVVTPVYGFIFLFNLWQIILLALQGHLMVLHFLRNLLLPAVVVYGLWRYRHEFRVKSDTQNFRYAIRTSLLLLAIALAYGIAGFMLLDTHDFHQEISLLTAIHRTVDQFNFTQSQALIGYTTRSRLFMDSLSTVSTVAVGYVFISLFQPIRARLSDQSTKRVAMDNILRTYAATSEDYFKLWPEDKQYFLNGAQTAGLAYKVHRGVVLVVGDPIGNAHDFDTLLRQFFEFCRLNDWLPAFIHTEARYRTLYESNDFAIQKIGEEAILSIDHFLIQVVKLKYFRQIDNKFKKQEYQFEVLQPPHNQAVLNRLREVSDQWLTLPGRVERGFMMGYYSDSYMQRCTVMILRDAAGTIQAFMNQLPAYNKTEANYDLLRHGVNAPTNCNDFLLMNFIRYVADNGFQTVNLGLCPLSGLDNADQDRTLIDNALKFVYTNGDRLYSFSGLRRFKAKYEPEWSSRYIAYRGGILGFSRTINTLNKVMKRK